MQVCDHFTSSHSFFHISEITLLFCFLCPTSRDVFLSCCACFLSLCNQFFMPFTLLFVCFCIFQEASFVENPSNLFSSPPWLWDHLQSLSHSSASQTHRVWRRNIRINHAPMSQWRLWDHVSCLPKSTTGGPWREAPEPSCWQPTALGVSTKLTDRHSNVKTSHFILLCSSIDSHTNENM